VAKAACWAWSDAEARRRGERTGLDTLVVHAVNDGHWTWEGSTPSVSQLTREVPRLGSTAARLKLKGIDGGPHKRWSMWFNSKQREEPYPGLTSLGNPGESRGPLRGRETGAAWLSSARVVRCWVKSRNERNPCRLLPAWAFEPDGDSVGTAGDKPEEGGDDVKSSWSLRPGLHTCYNGGDKPQRGREAERIGKTPSKFGLQSATRLHEAGIASNRGSATPR
jgi:hypothetical protein